MQALSDGHGGPLPHASVSQHENIDPLTGVSSKGVSYRAQTPTLLTRATMALALSSPASAA